MDPQFDSLVREVWGGQVHGCAMFVFQQKLKNLKSKLKELNRLKFGDLQLKVTRAREYLKQIQAEMGIDN